MQIDKEQVCESATGLKMIKSKFVKVQDWEKKHVCKWAKLKKCKFIKLNFKKRRDGMALLGHHN
jgi:hypothetical protein